MDTLTCNGVEKSFQDWNLNIDSIKSVKIAGGADTFTATILERALIAEVDNPTFPFESRIVVRTNRTAGLTGGTIKFVGYCVSAPAKAKGARQGVTYQFRGPWYHLENCDYMQSYKGSNVSYFLPETILNTSTAGTTGWAQIAVGDQIQDILQWLLAQYAQQGMAAPFQYKARALNSGKVDLSQNATAGTPGGDFGFNGKQYNFHLATVGLTIDLSLFSLFLPTYIEKPMKCSRALQKCLELSPRVNIWFDYATMDGAGNPLPTIRCDLIDAMPVVNLPVFTGNAPDGTSHKEINITPWEELSPRAVIIKYRITNTQNGQKSVDYAIDKWSPSGSNVNLDGLGNNAVDPNCGLRVINEMIDLQGFNETILEGHLDVEPVLAITASGGNTQEKKRTWWASERGGELPELKDTRARFQHPTALDVDYTEIPEATITNAATGLAMAAADLIAAGLCDKTGHLVLFRVVNGAYHAWMRRGDGQPVVTLKVKLSAKMSYTQYDCESADTNVDPTYIADIDETGNQLHFYNGIDHSVDIQLTNAVPDVGTSGFASFSTESSITSSESYIIGTGGIARYLYDHLNVLQYDGDYVMVGANFVDAGNPKFVTLGNRLNLTGGAVMWQAMNAQIQEITEDWGNKETLVKIGVAKTLSAGQLAQLFNMWRYRRNWYNPDLRADNNAGSNGDVDMAKSHGGANTAKGLADSGQHADTLYTTPPTGVTPGVVAAQLNHDPTLIKKVLDLAPGYAPVDLAKKPEIMEPREVGYCAPDGTLIYGVTHVGGFYTKP